MSDSERITAARDFAAELLYRTRTTGPFLADLFDERAEDSGLDARDRHLAYEIAAGVIRHRRTLDCVLNAFTRRAMVKSPPPLRLLLRMGAYQLLFLDRVPDHAAVDQTVELAKRWARPRIKKHPASIASYTNGVLRALAGARQSAESAGDVMRSIERPAGGFVVLDRDVLASPRTSPGEYLADAFSFDRWLAERWVARLGLDQAMEVARAQNRRPGMTLRVNLLRTTPENAADVLSGDGVKTRPYRPGMPLLRVLEGDAINSKAMQLGLVQPQDPWISTIVQHLEVRCGMTVLDRCAAPGTKTCELAELMEDKGAIYAVDVTEDGLERVSTNARRMGCHIVQTLSVEQLPERLLQVERIDRALVDAPCSNTGVLARRPEARWRVEADQMDAMVKTQCELLLDVFNWVSPGGKVLYATCSIEPEENEQVVDYVVKRRHGAARLIRQKTTLPSLKDDHDGGFWALMERVR